MCAAIYVYIFYHFVIFLCWSIMQTQQLSIYFISQRNVGERITKCGFRGDTAVPRRKTSFCQAAFSGTASQFLKSCLAKRCSNKTENNLGDPASTVFL